MGREEGSGWGTHVYLWRIHVDIWQNQYNIVKLKNKIKKIIYKKKPHGKGTTSRKGQLLCEIVLNVLHASVYLKIVVIIGYFYSVENCLLFIFFLFPISVFI